MSAGQRRLRRRCFRRAVSHSDLHQHFVTPGRIADDRVHMNLHTRFSLAFVLVSENRRPKVQSWFVEIVSV
jgi:hypothetical protein